MALRHCHPASSDAVPCSSAPRMDVTLEERKKSRPLNPSVIRPLPTMMHVLVPTLPAMDPIVEGEVEGGIVGQESCGYSARRISLEDVRDWIIVRWIARRKKERCWTEVGFPRSPHHGIPRPRCINQPSRIHRPPRMQSSNEIPPPLLELFSPSSCGRSGTSCLLTTLKQIPHVQATKRNCCPHVCIDSRILMTHEALEALDLKFSVRLDWPRLLPCLYTTPPETSYE
jgi:hypothetical protein